MIKFWAKDRIATKENKSYGSSNYWADLLFFLMLWKLVPNWRFNVSWYLRYDSSAKINSSRKTFLPVLRYQTPSWYMIALASPNKSNRTYCAIYSLSARYECSCESYFLGYCRFECCSIIFPPSITASIQTCRVLLFVILEVSVLQSWASTIFWQECIYPLPCNI